MKTEELVEFLEELGCREVDYNSECVSFNLHNKSFQFYDWKSHTIGRLCEHLVSRSYCAGFSAGEEGVRSDFRSLLRVEEGPEEYT